MLNGPEARKVCVVCLVAMKPCATVEIHDQWSFVGGVRGEIEIQLLLLSGVRDVGDIAEDSSHLECERESEGVGSELGSRGVREGREVRTRREQQSNERDE